MVPTSLRAWNGRVLEDTAANQAQIHQGREMEDVGGKADGRPLTNERRLIERRRTATCKTFQEVASVLEETPSTAISPHHHRTENAAPRVVRILIASITGLAQALDLSGSNPLRIVTYPTLPFTRVKAARSLRNRNLILLP